MVLEKYFLGVLLVGALVRVLHRLEEVVVEGERECYSLMPIDFCHL